MGRSQRKVREVHAEVSKVLSRGLRHDYINRYVEYDCRYSSDSLIYYQSVGMKKSDLEAIGAACRSWKPILQIYIKDRVVLPRNEIYSAWMGLVWRNIDLTIMNYPKRKNTIL